MCKIYYTDVLPRLKKWNSNGVAAVNISEFKNQTSSQFPLGINQVVFSNMLLNHHRCLLLKWDRSLKDYLNCIGWPIWEF